MELELKELNPPPTLLIVMLIVSRFSKVARPLSDQGWKENMIWWDTHSYAKWHVAVNSSSKEWLPYINCLNETLNIHYKGAEIIKLTVNDKLVAKRYT